MMQALGRRNVLAYRQNRCARLLSGILAASGLGGENIAEHHGTAGVFRVPVCSHGPYTDLFRQHAHHRYQPISTAPVVLR